MKQRASFLIYIYNFREKIIQKDLTGCATEEVSQDGQNSSVQQCKVCKQDYAHTVGIRQILQQSEDAFPEVPLINPHNIMMPGTIKAKRIAACLGQTATHSDVKTEQLCRSDLSNPG